MEAKGVLVKSGTAIYREELKNREFGKKVPQIVHSEQGAVFENAACSEDEKFEGKPTQQDLSIFMRTRLLYNRLYIPKFFDLLIVSRAGHYLCIVASSLVNTPSAKALGFLAPKNKWT